MRNRITLALIAGSLTMTLAGAPTALAAAKESQDPSKFEQFTNEAQAAISDAWMQGKLESALLFNEHLSPFAIDTEVKSGTVYLTGAVESEIDRDLAEEIAQSIEGIENVENELVIDKNKASEKSAAAENRSKFRQSVADATLTARIKSELLLNGSTSGLSINVDTEDGEVTLSGKVESDKESDLAEQIAANIDGTQNVENKLTVSSGS